MNKHELCTKFPWLCRLQPVADVIIETLFQKEEHYAGSWKKRGGIGAFMMMCRKWDRIEKLVGEQNYDVFAAIEGNAGDVRDDIDDLIGYLMLIRAHTSEGLKSVVPEHAATVDASTERGKLFLMLPWLGERGGPHSERGPVSVLIDKNTAEHLIELGIVRKGPRNILIPVKNPDMEILKK